jgi:hypothetical protein
MKRAFALLLLLVSLTALAVPSGPPDLSWPDGSRYWGAQRFNTPHGKGYLTGPDGRSYEGNFVDGKFHGRGVMRLPNGDEYQGGFVRGLFEGEGTYRYADGRPQDTGTWRQGKLQKPAEPQAKLDSAGERERERAALNVETALYRQRPLLDAALASLVPSERGRINLYLLAVGGDGTQEVFRREVEFVRGQFDRDFGTRGRSVALVNSRTTVATLPMATVTTIRESIRAIAARMDVDNDILFVFMTSHGAKDHEFRLNQSAMRLRGLWPKELAQMLDEARIRWRVVLVSACYSGGFLDPLKSDTTMVITAAHKDRTSFGCADENEFTYFGRAFFREALPGSASFQDAFARAQDLVGEWERKDGTPERERSLPQMHSARPIADQLQRWWAQRRP